MRAAATGDEELARSFRESSDADARRRLASELLGNHRRRVYLWCFRHTREHESALDLAQDVLLRAYEKLDSYEGHARFTTWLFVLTRNVCLSDRRRRRPDLVSDEQLLEVEDHGPTPEEQLLQRADQDALLKLMQSELDETERRAIWLRAVERLPVETITEDLGLTNATGARGLLQRARRKLRAALDAESEGA